MKSTKPLEEAEVLLVRGDLDADSAPRLLREVKECFAQGRVNLIIDLQDADSISNGGVLALQAVIARSAALDAKIRLRHANPRIRQLLDLRLDFNKSVC